MPSASHLVAHVRASLHLGPHAFRSHARSHVGCIRTLNEDAWLERSDLGLWAVADGMGGHAAGDVASQEVIRELERVSDFSSAFAFRRSVRNALFRANAVLQRMAMRELLDTVGSTAVVLMAYDGHYACTWAGDSRAYLLRSGVLKRITTDHSLATELVAQGRLSEMEARSMPQSSVITRAVGARHTLELDGVFGRIDQGDRFLLCSDGLCNTVTDADICRIVGAASLEAATSGLVDRALSRGAPDNVTCIVIDAGAQAGAASG